MAKLMLYIATSVLLGFLIAYYPVFGIILWGIFSLFLFSVKYEEKALFFVIFSLPFSFALNPATDIDLALNRALIVCLAMVWFINSLARKKLNIMFNIQSVLLAVFFILAAYSTLAADNAFWAWRKMLVFVSIFPLYILVSELCRNWLSIKKALLVMIASAVLASVIGIVQFFSQFIIGIKPVFVFWANYIAPNFYGINFGKLVIENPSWLVNIGGATYLRALSLFPDPHMFAFYLGLILPLVFSLLIFSFNELKQGKEILEKRTALFFIFSILLTSAILTYSRSGYIGIISAMAAVLVFSWTRLARFSKAVISAAAISILILAVFTNNSVSARLFSIADFEEGSNAGRIKIWREALEIIDANPVLGVGIGNYSLAIDPAADYRNSIYAHNAYLDIAAEMGVAAALIWLLLLGASIFQLVRRAGIEDAGDIKIPIVIGLAGSLISFSVSSLADTAIYSPAVLAMLMAVIGLTAAINTKQI